MTDDKNQNHNEEDAKIKRIKRVMLLSLLLSLGIHSYFIFIWTLKHTERLSKKEAPKEKRIKIVLKKKHQEKIPKQIAASEDKGINERPDDPKYLGKRNNKTKKETKASKLSSFKQAGKGVRDGEKKIVRAKKGGSKVATQTKVVPKKKKMRRKGRKKIRLADLAIKPGSPGEKGQKAQQNSRVQGIRSGKKGKVGLAQNQDFLENVKLGDFTNLNTVEYKFYGYYHRIRQKLEQYWGNSLREKAEQLYKTGKTLPRNVNKTTFLKITLNDQGRIVGIVIKSTSGVKELDDAAVESFNKAGPFPNPPKGLISRGRAEIEWGFVVKS